MLPCIHSVVVCVAQLFLIAVKALAQRASRTSLLGDYSRHLRLLHSLVEVDSIARCVQGGECQTLKYWCGGGAYMRLHVSQACDCNPWRFGPLVIICVLAAVSV